MKPNSIGGFIASALLAGLLSAASAYAAPICPDNAYPYSWDCDGPCPFVTKRWAGYKGRTIELRYYKKNRCAWGRILDWKRGDSLWVDHSTTNGNGWEGPLSKITKGFIKRNNYTKAYYDGGSVMRACGKVSGKIVCTGWW